MDRPPYPWDEEHPPQQWPASNEPAWINVAEVNSDADGDSVYADTIRHCTTWRQMADRSKTTTAHECTHGINSQIRNSAGQRMNGFYALGGRGIALPEPPIRKRDVASFVPNDLRGDRFSTYVTGQTAWDDSPLYLMDEWIAYRNGAACGLDMLARGESPEKTDLVRGPLEFSVYCLAMLSAAETKANSSVIPLLAFFRWLWIESWSVYRKGKDQFPFSEQDRFEAVFFGAAGEPLRDFADKYDIPVKGI